MRTARLRTARLRMARLRMALMRMARLRMALMRMARLRTARLRTARLRTALLLVIVACHDPPDPPPAPPPPALPRWSQARHVRWADLQTPVSRPLALVVDRGGGPLDRIVADADVTTFLNDRFTPLFLSPQASPQLVAGTVQVLDDHGCWLMLPTRPRTPAELIEALNGVMRDLRAGVPATPRPNPPSTWGIPLPAGHPLARPCPDPALSP